MELDYNINLKNVPSLKTAMYASLSGDAKEALKILDSIEISNLTNEEKEALGKFFLRFREKQKAKILKENSLITSVVEVFIDYWLRSLLKEVSIEEGDKFLLSNLQKLSCINYGSDTDPELEEILENLKKAINNEGYYCQIGRVKPFINFMLWKSEEAVSYDVELFDCKEKIEVKMMDNFKLLGWAGFATLNSLYVGGWADKKRLYCVKPAYDLSSEEFRISYLAHEARHFSDYKKFPKLSQLDLEYRAKLTELILSEKTFSDVLDKFENEMSPDETNPHSFSSYLIFENLDHSSKSSIKDSAQKLFDENTKMLLSQKTKSVVSILVNH